MTGEEVLTCAINIGEQLLVSGAEISRVEDSIRRLCASFGAERIDVLSITSSIVVTIYAPQFGAVTQTRRVAGQQYDLHRLEQLNQLSRRICTQYLSLEETEAALEEIRKTPQYPFGVQLFTYALISASFSLFFGGSVLDAVASGLIGVVLRYLDRIIRSTTPMPKPETIAPTTLEASTSSTITTAGIRDSKNAPSNSGELRISSNSSPEAIQGLNRKTATPTEATAASSTAPAAASLAAPISGSRSRLTRSPSRSTAVLTSSRAVTRPKHRHRRAHCV